MYKCNSTKTSKTLLCIVLFQPGCEFLEPQQIQGPSFEESLLGHVGGSAISFCISIWHFTFSHILLSILREYVTLMPVTICEPSNSLMFNIIVDYFTLTPASICGPLMISYCSTFRRSFSALFGPRNTMSFKVIEFEFCVSPIPASSEYVLSYFT